MLVFLLDCLRFSKLLEILLSVWCNFNNFASNPAGKQASCTVGLKPAAYGARFPAGLFACSYAGYLAGYLTGNGLSAGSAAKFSAGFS